GLDEAHAAIHQPAGQQARGAVGFGDAVVGTVQTARGLRLAAQVHQFRDRRLHAEGEFVVGDGRLDGVARPGALARRLVKALHQVHLALLRVRAGGATQVGDGNVAAAEQRTLVGRGQETAAEAIQAARRYLPRLDGDEPRQVLALAAEAVGYPGAH